MSLTIISIERVNEVNVHPNADRLDVIRVLGYQVVTGRGDFKVGNLAVYFPPDILLPSRVSENLGVTRYLKHAIFPGDTEKSQCRVAAARLRGIPSHGFVIPIYGSELPMAIGSDSPYGFDMTDIYGAHKYEPPVRLGGGGDAEVGLTTFHKFTNIENIQRYPDAFKDGEHVIVTEKIHGTNCRLGLVWDDDNDNFIFCAGSHNVRRKYEHGLYWEFMTQNVMNLLSSLSDDTDCIYDPCHDAILFGKIFGPGIQDLDYGRPGQDFRVFDISVDGVYLDYWDMVSVCDAHDLLVVPQLYAGPFSLDTIELLTYGASTFDGIKNKFKDREGCVIRPLEEAHSDVLGGRKILKSVSVDYRDRKGAKDVE